MPASPGNELGARPSSPTSAEAVAEWEARTYPRLRRYATPPPGAVELDDVLPTGEEQLADPAAARIALAEELHPGA